MQLPQNNVILEIRQHKQGKHAQGKADVLQQQQPAGLFQSTFVTSNFYHLIQLRYLQTRFDAVSRLKYNKIWLVPTSCWFIEFDFCAKRKCRPNAKIQE